MKKLSGENKKRKGSSGWNLVYDSFRPSRESLREALTTLGNGYFAVRGALSCEEFGSRLSYPATYMAGLFNTLKTKISGREVSNESMVNLPNWLYLSFRLSGGEFLSPSNSKIKRYRQELDAQHGILTREICFRDKKGRCLTVREERLVHIKRYHLGAVRFTVKAENFSGPITVKSSLDGGTRNSNVDRYRGLNNLHFKDITAGADGRDALFLSARTSRSGIRVALASRLRFFRGKEEKKPKVLIEKESEKKISRSFVFKSARGREYTIERITAVYKSSDKGIPDALKAAKREARSAPRFAVLLDEHFACWRSLWKTADIRIKGDAFSQLAVRLHIFHLLQTLSPNIVNMDVGAPARGLHGEAYRGHIFWDELFILPFFNICFPDISRALLMYRYRRLPKARSRALKEGFRGAMFPWQSGSSGDEETQQLHLNPLSGKWGSDYSFLQRHVSLAVAYNVWRYWKESADNDFMTRYGTEIFLSVAQFASSLCFYDPVDGRYHTAGIMGPDEFHEKYPEAAEPGLKDNSYTNFFIAWLLTEALQLMNFIPPRERKKLFGKIKLTAAEIERFRDISRGIKIIISKEGIISQFAGYFDLKEIDWGRYKKKYGRTERMDRILKAEGKTPNAYKASKQGDVLMLFYCFPPARVKSVLEGLGYNFPPGWLEKNYDYYVKRTSHGSTLSKIVHGYIAHLLDRRAESSSWLKEILKSDIYDTQGGTTSEGIHMGVMGGSLDMIYRALAGLRMVNEHLRVTPRLPDNWTELRLRFGFRDARLTLNLNRKELKLRFRGIGVESSPLPLEVEGKRFRLFPGKTHRIKLGRAEKRRKSGRDLFMAGERILVVEGDFAMAEMLKTRLEEEGYLAESVHNGNEALKILEEKWFDLVCMGVVLRGGMNGYSFFKEIKKREHLRDIPVIVNSGKAAMKNLFLDLGAEAFLLKPFDADKISGKVRELLKG